ncbi:amino acid adenylation domain-containing protein [Streptomyces sp. BRA346]|uniref:amino acid adenylation domain-containing protein n=1 Tax=Streptomyces sp. BRA346 TaxID=2878199 RepID=UPI0040642027
MSKHRPDGDHAATRAHWLTALRGMTRDQLLPPGGATVPAPPPERVPPPVAAALRRIGGDDPVGLHLLLLAATRLAMASFGAGEDLAVVCPAPGSSGPGELILRTRLEPETRVSDFLGRLHSDLVAAAGFPLRDRAALITRLDAVGHAESSAVRQLAVSWQGAHPSPGPACPADVSVRGRSEAGGGLEVRVTGPDGRVPASVAALARCTVAALAAIVADPHQRAGEVDALGPDQRAELERWSGLPLLDAFAPRTLVDLVDASAVRHPERVAVVDEGTRWTHGDLMHRSRHAAAFLAEEHGVGRGDRIALLLPRGAELVLAVLAVLRAGAAYVPIDPKHPEERIRRLLRRSGARIVIGAAPADQGLPTVTAHELRTVSRNPAPEGPRPDPVRPDPVRPEDEAVVFFTSGSTGLPRPIALRHDQIRHKAVSSAALVGIDEDTRCALLSAISSDATTYQIFVTLGAGGTLVAVGAPDELDPVTFWERIRSRRVTMVNCVPSLLSAMLDVLPENAGLPLRHVFLGGDTVPRGLLPRTRGRLRVDTFANLYGPSEATIECTTFLSGGDRAAALDAVPIGRPSPGFGVLVLTPWNTMAPVGVPGEMYVAGPGVADGYLDEPEATAARFVRCPLPGIGRVFRTGDLARWNSDGTLDFLGRADDQIQVHGNRVEPGEVEQALVEVDGVREAVVLARPGPRGDLTLAAWYTADSAVAPEAVRAHMAAVLPPHMVPRAYRQTARLPRTPHGKIDRAALLAAPEPEAAASWVPADEASHAVTAAWEKVFGRPPRSAGEDFFEIGGHSLTAAQLVGALCAGSPAHELAVRQVFAARTPGALTTALRQSLERDRDEPTDEPTDELTDQPVDEPAGPRKRWHAATNAQRRMWLLESLDEGEVRTYNMVETYALNRPLEQDALEAAVQYLVARHEALRTVFVLPEGDGESDGELRQVVLEPSELLVQPFVESVEPHAYDATLLRCRAEEARWRFDLASGPLFRMRYLSCAGRPPVLLFNIHHAVNDGWSYTVLVRDLMTAAAAFERGEKPRLPRSTGYLAHSRALERRLTGARGEKHARFWRDALAGLPPTAALPVDHPPGRHRSNAGGLARIGLGERLTGDVRALSVRSGATAFMVYVAAVRVLLHRLGGAADLPLGTVVAGRGAARTADEVGLFVNTVVLRTPLAPDGSFADLLEAVRRTALDVQEHEEYPFDRVVDDLGIRREHGRNPLFDVLVETVLSGTISADAGGTGLTARHLRAAPEVCDFDLTFGFLIPEGDSGDPAEVWVGYRDDLFTARSAARFGEQLRELLQELVRDPHAPLAQAATAARPIPAPAPPSVVPEHLPRPAGDIAPTGDTPLLGPVAELWSEVFGHPVTDPDAGLFELGGHSLTAARIVALARSVFGVEVPLRAAFEHQTVREFAAFVARQPAIDGHGEPRAAVARPKDAVPAMRSPATSAQRRIWLATRSGPPTAFNVSAALLLPYVLEPGPLGEAVRAVIERHESLRTRFRHADGELFQEVVPAGSGPLPLVSVELPADTGPDDPAVTTVAMDAREVVFDPEHGPLFQIRHLRGVRGGDVLVVTAHHLIWDGASLDVFARDLLEACAQTGTGPPRLPTASAGLREWAAAEDAWLDSVSAEPSLAYWRARLAPPLPLLDLSGTPDRPAKRSPVAGVVRRRLDPEVSAAVRSCAAACDASTFMAVVAAFTAVLRRSSGARDLLLGFPISPVERPPVVGCFVDELPLRLEPAPDLTRRGLLSQVRDRALEAYEHGRVPLDRLVRELRPPRHPGRQLFFDAGVSWEGTRPGPGGEADGRPFRTREYPPLTPPVTADLRLFAREEDGRLLLELSYDPALFGQDRAGALADEVAAELVALHTTPERPLSQPPAPAGGTPEPHAATDTTTWGTTSYEF